MKKWIYFACVVLFFALNYSVEVTLKHAGKTEELFSFHGSKLSYVLCLMAAIAALAALFSRDPVGRMLPLRRVLRWSVIPKWPFLAFLPVLAQSNWSTDGYPARDGVIQIRYGWFRELDWRVYFAIVATVILVELALHRQSAPQARDAAKQPRG